MENTLNYAGILQLGLGFWGSKTLLSAVELGLFTELANGPLDAGTLSSRLELHPRSAADFLDALVALGMLRRENGRYQNTPETAAFLDRNKPAYVGGMLEMANARLYPFWGHLTEALRTGKPQNEVAGGGEDPFAVLYSDPERLRGFLKAMTGLSLHSARAIAATFPFARYKTVCDIGCAQGGTLVEILKAHEHLSGIGFDLPPVGPVFEEYVEAHGLTPRLSFQGGDFFHDPLPKVDVLLFGHILHDWGEDVKRDLMKHAYEALPSGGAVVVHDAIIDDGREKNAFGLLMSLNMLIETPAGFDYTGAQCRKWMEAAGFQNPEVHPLGGPDSIVVATKP